MEVLGELTEFGASAFFLADLFLALEVFLVAVEKFADVFVLGGDVGQVLLSCVEVMLIFARVIAPITTNTLTTLFTYCL